LVGHLLVRHRIDDGLDLALRHVGTKDENIRPEVRLPGCCRPAAA
jgi:hypothetical protein